MITAASLMLIHPDYAAAPCNAAWHGKSVGMCGRTMRVVYKFFMQRSAVDQ